MARKKEKDNDNENDGSNENVEKRLKCFHDGCNKKYKIKSTLFA